MLGKMIKKGVDNAMGGKSKSVVLTQKDVSKIVQARIDSILKSVEDIAVKAANATTATKAVAEIDKSLNNFANAMNGKGFKGLWFKFIKFKRNVQKMVKYTNSLSEITKDAEPGIRAIATISYIAEALAKTIKNVASMKVPVFAGLKLKRVNKVLARLEFTMMLLQMMGQRITPKDIMNVKQVVTITRSLKEMFDTINDIHVGLLFTLKMKRVILALRLVQVVIRKVSRMRRIGAALSKIILIQSFFTSLALMFLTVIIIAPVFLIAPLALLVIALGLWLFSLVMKLIVKIMRKAAWRAVVAMLLMSVIFLAMAVVVVMLLVIAMLAKPVLTAALWILGLLLFMIVLAVILMVLGIIVINLIAIVGPAIVGLALMCGLLLMVFITMVFISMMVGLSKQILNNAGWLMGALASIIVIVALCVAVGMAGAGAIIGLAFMPFNIALVGMTLALFLQLFMIQKLKIDKKAIIQSLRDVKAVISVIKNLFGKFEFPGRVARSAKRMLRRVKRIVRQINSIARKLNRLQGIKLNAGKIFSNVGIVWKVVDQLEAEMSDAVDPTIVSGDFLERWKARQAAKRKAKEGNKILVRAKRILRTMKRLVNKLTSLQKVELDSDKILGNIGVVFTTVDEIEKFIEKGEQLPKDFTREELRQFNRARYAEELEAVAAKGKLKRTDAIVGRILKITNTLGDIEKIKLNESLILDNLSMMFRFVDVIDEFIQEHQQLPDNFTSDDFKSVTDKLRSENLQTAFANGKLSKTDAILIKIKSISDTLTAVQKTKIDSSLAKDKVTQMFAVGNELFDLVMNGTTMNPKEAELIKGWYSMDRGSKAGKAQKAALDKYREQQNEMVNQTTEHINKVESILNLVTGMAEKFTEISKLNVKPDVVVGKIQSVFSTVDLMMEVVKNNQYADLDTTAFQDKYATILDVIGDLNSTLSNLAQVDSGSVGNQSKMLDNYGKFIDKVNTIDVDKVKTTTDMFGQMARFSESVNGNFDALAQSINENLMPVLEELKKIMEEIPQKLESGFANTSASIGAAGATDSASVEAQIKRENPNLTPEQIAKEVKARISTSDSNKAKGVEGKLDSILKLMQGQTGKVRVSM